MDSIFQRDLNKRGGQAALAAEKRFEYYEKIQELQAKLVPCGYALAKQIEGIREDSSALLKLLHGKDVGKFDEYAFKLESHAHLVRHGYRVSRAAIRSAKGRGIVAKSSARRSVT